MKRMLFNATHAEELRVAIVDGQKLIDLDIETAGREQRKNNIYKGVITRVEPSLEACFVNYGEERHGFLPFKEVSKIYFKPGIEIGRARVQDALEEGQEILVQIEKEERGNKGAALTTFISLAGRYLVLMPNNPRGGGVSRRVEGEDRQELRDTMDQLDYPQGMSIIARTAGIGRTLEELQWDLNYLLQLWRAISDAGHSAPGAFLIYQESSLVIRAIRDYLQPDIGEILIDTDDIYEQARQFMAHVMPDSVHRVKRYRDDIPLFSRFQIEHQIETAYSRTVPLPSGGAVVIDHTEALVAIDVNSARATRGADIEDTAVRTNIEAAEEVARQLRLRDLGGLIVIDFIDMESSKNQRDVEQKLKDALHHDRARVQMGKISRFGLMELSRQRLRPALNEGSHTTCPRCTGTGVIRDTESSALHVLRIVQEEAMKESTATIQAQVPVDVATFLLNEKRSEIHQIEARLKVNIILIPNKYIETPHYHLERLRHDDERLELGHASYTIVNPVEESIYHKKEEQAIKPRQEAVVKGITPTQPAPLVALSNVENTAQRPALIKRILNMFGIGIAKLPEEEKTKAIENNKPARRKGRRERPGRERNQRRERTEKPVLEMASGDDTEKRNENRREQNQRTRKENHNNRNEKHTKRETKQGQRFAPGQPAANESPIISVSLPAQTDDPSMREQNHPQTSSNQNIESSNEERHSGRGRRGRGRRNRGRSRGEGRNEGAESHSSIVGEEISEAFSLPQQAAESIELTVAPLPPVNINHKESNLAARVYEQHQTPAPILASTPAEHAPTIPQQLEAIVSPAIYSAMPVKQVFTPIPPDPQAQESTVATPPVIEPVSLEASIAATIAPADSLPLTKKPLQVASVTENVPATMPLNSLLNMLEKAGLQMALTDTEKLARARENTAQVNEPAPIPRERKPLPPTSNEPLTQIETRRPQ